MTLAGIGSDTAILAAASSSFATSSLLNPLALLVLCVIAGVGTALAMPTGKATLVRRLGGIFALLGLIGFLGYLGSLSRDTGAAMLIGGQISPFFWLFSAISVFAAFRVITHERPVYSALYFVLSVFGTAGLFILLWAEFMAAALVIIYAGAILITYVFVIMLASEGGGGVASRDVGMEQLAECDKNSKDRWVASCLGFVLMGAILLVVFNKAEHLTAATNPRTVAMLRGEFETDEATTQAAPVAPPVQADLPWQAPHTTASADVAAAAQPTGAAAELSPVQQLGLYLFQSQVVNLQLGGLLLTIAMIGAIMIARRQVQNDGTMAAQLTEIYSTPATPGSDNPHSIPVYGTDNPRAKEYPQL
jgi:NADH-quinone oxidoreductase subunit J